MSTRFAAVHALFVAMLALPAATGLTGCVADDELGAAQAMGTEVAGPVVIDEAGDGQTFDVVEGQPIVVRLPGNPTTGYAWSVASTDRTFGYPTESYLPEGEAHGSGGVYEFVWQSSGPFSMVGLHTVTLEYKRSWETEAADTFTFSVNIVPKGAPPAEVVVVDDDDDGTTVAVTEGTDVAVRLAGNPTTGYAWAVAAVDKTFGYPESEQYVPNDESIGGGGIYEFVWATDGGLGKVGLHTVTLEYKRSWETEAAETFTVTIDVQPAP